MTDHTPYMSTERIEQIYFDTDRGSIAAFVDDLYRLRADIVDAADHPSPSAVARECRRIAAKIKAADQEDAA